MSQPCAFATVREGWASVSLSSSNFMKGIAKRFLTHNEVETLGSRGKAFSLK